MIRWLAIVALLALPAMADDAAVRGQLEVGAKATVTEVVDGDTVIISPAPGGARQVRLDGEPLRLRGHARSWRRLVRNQADNAHHSGVEVVVTPTGRVVLDRGHSVADGAAAASL